MATVEPQTEGFAKLVTSTRVRPAAKEAFLEWNGRLTDALQSSGGFRSREVIPPQSGNPGEWISVTRFDSYEALCAWRNSGARARLLEEARPLLEEKEGFSELAGDAATQYHVENSVTEVVMEHVRPGKEAAYRAWSARIQKAQSRFSGYQGGYTQPPSAKGAGWMTLLRFATLEDLNRWLASEERAALLREAQPLVASTYLHRVDAAFPGWAPVNPETGGNPPNWKTTLLVLLGLYPIVSLEIAYLMGRLTGVRPALADFVGNAISVTLVAYVTMPLLVRAMGWWLFPKPERARKATLLGVALIAILYALEIGLFWSLL